MADRERSRSSEPTPAPAADTATNGDVAPADNGGGAENNSEEEVKLYVGNLDYATDETKLRSAFGQFGTVTDVFLPTERVTQRRRGFGVVTMSARTEAENAIANLDQSQLDGRTIRVIENRPKGSSGGSGAPRGAGGFNPSGEEKVKLYVGNLSFDTTQESVQQLFEPYGTVSDCFMPTDRDTGKGRGFCYVTMPAAVATDARNKLDGYKLDGHILYVVEARHKLADCERSRSPEPAPAPAADTATNGDVAPAPADSGGGAENTEEEEVKLCVFNLDYATDETKLRSAFGQFGTVTDVFLPTERGTQRPRGFGFVTMSARTEAENAIANLDQSQLDGRTIRVYENRPKGSGSGSEDDGDLSVSTSPLSA